jgi:pilus assembly protein CpaE
LAAGHVLILGTDREADGRIASILEAHGLRVVSAADAEAGLAQAGQARLVVIDQVTGRLDAAALCARIRSTPGLSQLPILCLAASEDVEERVRFLEAGADDVMARPFDALELEARVDGLLARTVGMAGPVRAEPGRDARDGDVPSMVAFFGPKGGSGTTTLAVNVAVALASTGQRSVALVDLDVQWGDVLSHLNLVSRQTVIELARDPSALAERELVASYAQRHASGLSVFGAPARPDDADQLAVADVSRLLAGLTDVYDLVVIDAGSTYDAQSQTVLDHADRVVIPIIPEIPALRAVRTLLEMLGESDRASDTRILVLNHLFARDMLRRQDIEGALGAQIDVELPHDPGLYLASANAGEPITTAAPRTAPGERLLALAALLEGKPVPVAPQARTRGERPSLSSLLKRG